jgi:hypothetical protein
MLMAKCISPASPDWISARVKFVHGSETTSDLTFSNLALGDSGEGGIKVGYYLPREWVWNILGVEGELYYHSPTIKAQTVGMQQAGIGPIPSVFPEYEYTGTLFHFG